MTDLERYFLDKYGPVLTTKELAEVFKFKNPNSVLNAISAETFPVSTRLEGKRRVADYWVVAAHFQALRSTEASGRAA